MKFRETLSLVSNAYTWQRLQARVRSALVAETDFQALPFSSHTFDTIVNVGGYRYVSAPEKYWAEMKRVTKTEGRVVVVQFYPRISTIYGCDIGSETEFSRHFFLHKSTTIPAIISVMGMPVRTGEYKIFEYKLLA